MVNDNHTVVTELLNSYRKLGGLNKCDSTNLPSKRAVARICEELLTLLFPGFFDEEAVPESELEMLTAERVSLMSRELHKQIAKSLRCKGQVKGDCFRRVTGIVSDFLAKLPEVRLLLKTDVEAALEGDPAATSVEEVILSYPCIEAIAIQRMAHLLYEVKVPIMPRMMTEWAHSQTGIDIHPGAKIGPYFFIDHGTGVVIGETCVIGSHVKLYDGVTLGARSFPKDASGKIVKGKKRHPNVEDNVTIYANATILGGETVIGANSTIGANAFLLRGVPANSLVALEELEHRIVDKTQRAAEPIKELSRLSGKPPMLVRSGSPESGVDAVLTKLCRTLVGNLKLMALAENVEVVWNRRLTSTAGSANFKSSRISLNPRLREISDDEIDRTLRHELAHLIAHARAGKRRIDAHGPEWRQACAELGIPGEQRCHDLPLPRRKQLPKYAYQCPGCGGVLLRIRPLRRFAACYHCCRDLNHGRYSSAYAYESISVALGMALVRRPDDEA